MNKNNPDYHIEIFWLNFKQSMKNYYNNDFKRPIDYWSNELNNLQKLQKYNMIEDKIRNYISLFAIDLMKNLEDYHIRILITNIKRWNKLSKLYVFNENLETYHNIIFLLIDIYKSLLEKALDDDIKIIFSQIELFILWKDFSSLIEYAIKNKKPSIIDKINKYDFTIINNHIENIYNVKLNSNLSGFKLLKIIESK